MDMKTENTITLIAFLIGGLSLTDLITWSLGLIALITAIVANWFSLRKNKSEKWLADFRFKNESEEKEREKEKQDEE